MMKKMAQDYTKYSKEELIDKLIETNDKLELLLECIPGGAFTYDADSGKFEYISSGVLSIFNCSEEEFRDRFYNKFELMIEKDDRANAIESINNQLKFFNSVELTYRVNDIVNPNATWIYHKAKLEKRPDGTSVFFVCISDVTEEKMVQESMNDIAQKLFNQVERDTMTGLFNKGTMEKEVANYLLSKTDDSLDAILMIDTDNFKSVNDTFGHAYGDDIIKFVATQIDTNFRSSDYKGRMGGDEFMVFMKGTSRASVENRARMLNDKIRRDCISNGQKVHISCSIGIAFAPNNAKTYEDLFKAADAALYEAKESGKDCYKFA